MWIPRSRTPALRNLVAETRLSVDDLVAPLFVREGITEPQPIASLPGVVQHTRESLRKEVTHFGIDPWPTTTYVTNTGLVVIQELFVLHGSPTVLLSFRLQGDASESHGLLLLVGQILVPTHIAVEVVGQMTEPHRR